MFSEPVRRSAMERARDTNTAALSGKVVLVQETDKEVQAGTLMYVPVYRQGMPTETVLQRRAAIYGWVYSPYRMKDLMLRVFNRAAPDKGKKIGFQLFDGEQLSAKSLLYESHPVKDQKYLFDKYAIQQIPIDFNGKIWTLRLTQTSSLFTVAYIRVWLFLASGILVTFLMSLLLHTLLRKNKELQHMASILEEKVTERTEDLSETNRRLAAEIIERDNIEKVLRESEERYWILLSQASDGIIIMTSDGRLTRVNEAFARMHGYSTDEMLHMNIRDLDTALTTELAPERMGRIMAGETLVFEVVHYHKSGLTIPLEASASRISFANITYIQAIHRDLTERKRLVASEKEAHAQLEKLVEKRTEQLQQERQRLAGIIEGTNAGAWEWNVQTGEVHFDERLTNIFGYTLAELAPISVRTWLDLIHPDDLKVSEANLRRHFSGRTDHYECEFRMKHKNGAWVWVLSHGRVNQRTPEGKPLHMSGIHRNITESKNVQNSLDQITTRLTLAARAGGIGIWDYDITNNHLLWDEQMFKLYGLTPETFGGAYETWQSGMHPDDRQRGDAEIQMALSGEKELDTEFRVVWPDGTIHHIRAFAIVQRDAEGKAVRMIGTNYDVSRDKLEEEKLRIAMHAADAANRAKSAFLANMSHEIRTPMSGVLGMTGLLLSTPLTKRQREYAEKIRTSGGALLTVLNDILDFSRMEAGKMAIETIAFSLEDLIGNVLSLLGPQAAEKRVELHAFVAPNVPAALMGDPQRLTQVINNLLGNAVKFTERGDIRLEAKILRRTEASVDLEISVQDTGIGMTEEDLSRVFTAFSQADGSTTRRFGGTGLGLAISLNLVELMGGTIRAKSAPGNGSTFTIILSFPIAQEFARTAFPALPINPESTPINPVTPARPEVPPGDFAELMPLLDDLRKALASDEPLPCKEIMTTLLKKSWPEEQEILLLEVNRLVRSYRLQEALDLLSDGKKASDRPLINMLT
jgi:PAS domain S-box-containing protein